MDNNRESSTDNRGGSTGNSRESTTDNNSENKKGSTGNDSGSSTDNNRNSRKDNSTDNREGSRESRKDSSTDNNREILKELNTIRKWAMFLSLVGFIAVGSFAVTGFFTGIFLSVFNVNDPAQGFPAWLSFIITIFMFLLLLFPVIYLFRFSRFTSSAVRTNDNTILKKAIRNLKTHYLCLGILVIVMFVLYFLILILTMIST